MKTANIVSLPLDEFIYNLYLLMWKSVILLYFLLGIVIILSRGGEAR